MYQSPTLNYTFQGVITRRMLTKKFILALLLFVISVGLLSCKPKTNSGSESFSQAVSIIDIYRFLYYTNRLNCENLIKDKNYIFPTVNWVKGPYTERLNKILFDNGLTLALEEANDCDDFARSGKFAASVAYLHDGNRIFKTALAFGECHYIPENILDKNNNFFTEHAINFFIVIEDFQWKLKFYEPQTRKLIELNEVEKATILYWEL